MTDSRRTFLQRFSVTAVAMGSCGAAGLLVGCVYGPPPPPDRHESPFAQDLEAYQASVGSHLPFGLDSIVLAGEPKAQLDRQIAWLKAHPVFDVRVEVLPRLRSHP
ncbi:hypothetical protein [Magnetospirillum moscoviense]|nr:hypothetical protein [Magnetospirillum moscoviense]